MDFFKSEPGKLPITEEDKDWIEENFEWLIQNVGVLTLNDSKVIDSNDPMFEKSTPEEITKALCEVLEINSEQISISLYEDIKSKKWTLIAPLGEYEDIIDGYREFEKDGEVHFEITLAKSLLDNKFLLASSLAYQLTRIKLRKLNLQFDTGEDTGIFLYLAAIYFGFGLFISNSVFVNENGWVAQSHIPIEVIGYALAYYCWLKNDQKPWTDEISRHIKPHFSSSLKFIETNPPEVYTQNYISHLVDVSRVEKEAFDAYDTGNYEKAVEMNAKLEDLDQENPCVINNSGYFKLRLKKFEDSIRDFENAIELDPEFAFPYNNKGYALLMQEKLEEGYRYINQSLLLDENNAYAYRNLGIYFCMKQDFDTAYKNFQIAIELDPGTELLHHYYGIAMLENGDLKEAMIELELSSMLGERESLLKLLEIKGK